MSIYFIGIAVSKELCLNLSSILAFNAWFPPFSSSSYLLENKQLVFPLDLATLKYSLFPVLQTARRTANRPENLVSLHP